MEVHHHPKSEGKAKSLKEYFLEGAMIFLAVFMGFIAENIRESFADHSREKEYIYSIIDDIKSDTAQSQQVLSKLKRTKLGIDTLLVALTSEEIKTNSNKACQLWSRTLGFADFIYNDRTIQQLKNNGGLRVIRNKAVSDSIMSYDQTIRYFYTQANLMNGALVNQTIYQRMFDFIRLEKDKNQSTPVPLPIEGVKILNEAYANRKIQVSAVIGLIERLQQINAKGKRVLKFIKDQYEIDKTE